MGFSNQNFETTERIKISKNHNVSTVWMHSVVCLSVSPFPTLLRLIQTFLQNQTKTYHTKQKQHDSHFTFLCRCMSQSYQSWAKTNICLRFIWNCKPKFVCVCTYAILLDCDFVVMPNRMEKYLCVVRAIDLYGFDDEKRKKIIPL